MAIKFNNMNVELCSCKVKIERSIEFKYAHSSFMLVHARSSLSSLITWANDSIPMRKNGVTGVIFLSLAGVTRYVYT